MKRLWQQIIRGERGQALPIVLAVMIIGGLMIAPALNHISTSLNAGMIVEKNVKGVYAAEAGVEDVLWLLTEGREPTEEPQPLPLPEYVNQMQVSMLTEDKGTYALYFGDLIVVGEHPQEQYNSLAINGEWGEWDEEAEAYPYTISVTWQGPVGTIHLEEVGVRLPIGYDYVDYSAADFDENLSMGEPDDPIEQDWAGAQMPNWSWEPASRPIVSEGEPMQTQKFYVTGVGEREGDYTWAEGDPNSVGQVGEFTSKLYRITSTARSESDEVTAKIVADVVVDDTDDEVYIVRWQINPQ